MTVFQVRDTRSCAIVWTGMAADADRAIELTAQAAGFHSADEMPGTMRAGLSAEALVI